MMDVNICRNNILLDEHLQPKVSDFGFSISGGSRISKRGVVVHSCARSACKILEATPTLGQNHAHFRSFLIQTTSPTSPIDLFSNEFSSKAF